jgi:hypothetical protein
MELRPCVAGKAVIQQRRASAGTPAGARRLLASNEWTEMIMSDYRDPNDPLRHSTPYTDEWRGSNAGWGWVAAAVFAVIVLAIAFGIRNEPTHTASNDATQTTRMAPPPATNPGIASPANPAMMPRPAPVPAPTPGQGSQ